MSKEEGFPSKLEKKLPTGFKEDADSLDTDELKKVIIASEGNIVSIEREMDADEKLSAAKELVKDLSSAYRDAKSAQTAKIKYCLHLLEGRGEDLDSR